MKKKIYLLAGISLLLDQITKVVAALFLNHVAVISGFFSLTYVENTGAAWGIFDNNRILLICISVVTILIISYGMLIGGIFGNLFDRIFRGYVIDFFNFNIFGYDFPVFNIADTLIVIGVILMVIDVVKGGLYGNNCKQK